MHFCKFEIISRLALSQPGALITAHNNNPGTQHCKRNNIGPRARFYHISLFNLSHAKCFKEPCTTPGLENFQHFFHNTGEILQLEVEWFDFFDFSSLSSMFMRLINWLSSLPTLPSIRKVDYQKVLHFKTLKSVSIIAKGERMFLWISLNTSLTR